MVQISQPPALALPFQRPLSPTAPPRLPAVPPASPFGTLQPPTDQTQLTSPQGQALNQLSLDLDAPATETPSHLPPIARSETPPSWSTSKQASILRSFEAGLRQHGLQAEDLTRILRENGISALEITPQSIQDPANAAEITRIQTVLNERLNHPELRALGQGVSVGRDGELGPGTILGLKALQNSQRGEPISLDITPIKQQTRTGCYRASEAMMYNVLHGKDGQPDAYDEFDARDRIREADMDFENISVIRSENGSGRVSVNPARMAEALARIDAELEAGRPLIAGVSYRKQDGREYNEGVTDHFGVISGRGQDEVGTYYTFQDPAQGGSHKLRLDPVSGRLSGRGDMAGVYDVTLVRNATGIAPETLDHYQRMGKVMFSQGERSAEIGWMQTQLSSLGYDTKGTGGAYGNGTRDAIRAFQSANNLPVTGGSVDHHTLAAIESAFRSHQQSQPAQVMFQKGQTHAQLRPLQQALTRLGYNTGGTNGQFGPRTEAAVRAFQTAEGLPVSGKIDNQTWLHILACTPRTE